MKPIHRLTSLLLFVVGAAVFAQEADTAPTFSLERKDKTIVMSKRGPDESGLAIFCDQDPNTRGIFYDPSEEAVVATIDDNRIKAPLAIMDKKENGDGHLEMSSGKAIEDDDGDCPQVEPQSNAGGLKITKGKTQLSGSKLVYDEKDGLANIDGPITFEREQKDGKLTGTSQKLVVDVDKDTTVLKGSVQLKSGERTSSAEEVEYSEKDNVAILRGTPQNPAKSIKGKEELTATTIRYNLETNDVVATTENNNIKGKFEDEDRK
ncbi:LptA/OstA family protein [Deinococcus cellulosilyticus]|uniref:Organic solvent tolerance-like N-terminal domain-containing protein n=1 Tax=Deinococcus cellulosilyticus (strain DSM 18568 / NBRC 106333 / KACC 11606 / 5516J-15) TaxID=1223518 RepID=A0A511N5I3_DEIC1|nr:LptA/OstA family protein [Deinococcus cellulosilyticus]GEM48103.1 hypothetical protein DC3_37380 [Deinococcus cellulosilyticus NBRC 106333 = KACC 11606]